MPSSSNNSSNTQTMPRCTAMLKTRPEEQCRCSARHEHAGEPMCGTHLRLAQNSMECSICLCPVSKTSKRAQVLECQHGFHRQCLRRWFCRSLTCPNCRKVCVSSLLNGTEKLSMRVILLMRAIPPRSTHAFFSSYMMWLLTQREAIEVIADVEDRHMLMEIAIQSMGAGQFYAKLHFLEL